MKKENKVWAITLIALGLFTSNQVSAQPDSLRTHQLQEVVVTATKFPKNESETGKVLTVIDRDELNHHIGKDITQLLNEQVGLVVSGANSNTGKDKSVYLRGAKNEYTLILIDGVPLNDPSGISGGAYDLRLISLDQVERIEILKGSQSTLYGSDAIAGVINIITKNPEEAPMEFAGNIGYGSYKTLRGSGGIRGGSNKIGYHISYSGLHTEGMSEAAERGTTPFDKDGSTQHSFQSSIHLQPTRSISIKPFLRYSTFKGKYDAGAFTDDILNTYDAKLLNTGLNAAYKLKRGSIHAQYSYDQTDRIYDGTYGKAQYFGKFHQTEVYGNVDVRDHFQMLTGVALQQYRMMDKTATKEDPGIILFSPYVSLLNRFGKLSTEIGGRFNYHTQFGNNFTYSFNPSYLLLNQVKLFVNLSTGFKAPSLYQLYGQYGANPELRPEKSHSTEFGTQWLSSNNQVEMRVVAFTRQINDVIVYVYPNNLNLDQQNDHGIELESSFKVNSKINARLHYAYTTGKVLTHHSGSDTTYYNLYRRPKHTMGLSLGYQVNSKFNVTMTSNYYGTRVDLYYDSESFTNQTIRLGSYTLINLSADYAMVKGKATVFIHINNLLNTNYQEIYGYNTMGLNIYSGVRVKL